MYTSSVVLLAYKWFSQIIYKVSAFRRCISFPGDIVNAMIKARRKTHVQPSSSEWIQGLSREGQDICSTGPHSPDLPDYPEDDQPFSRSSGSTWVWSAAY